MIKISLRQLRYLQAVVHCGHFGRAAEACHITQPALSMQIRQLEQTLGVTLLERTAGGSVPTPAGREVLRRATEILSRTQDLVDFARHAGRTLVGELRLGVIPTISPYLLPRALPQLARQYPELDLKLRETQTANLITELGEGRLDVILAALPIEAPETEAIALFDDRFLLAVPSNHRLAGTAEASLSSVERERLLLLEEGHCFRDQALSFCAAANPELIEGFGATSFATLLQMVANGYGLTLLPEMAVESEASRRKGLSVLPLVMPEPRRTVGLVWRRSSPRKVDFIALGKLLTDIAVAAGWPVGTNAGERLAIQTPA